MRDYFRLCLSLLLLLVVSEAMAASGPDRKAIKELGSRLDAAEEVVGAGERWCRDVDSADEVGAVAFDVFELARRLREQVREGTKLHRDVWGPGGLKPRGRALREEHDRCARREQATVMLAQVAEAAEDAGSGVDLLDAAGWFEQSVAAWSDADGLGPPPGFHDACAALQAGRTVIPEGEWRDLDLDLLHRRLEVDTSALGCPPSGPDDASAAARAEATLWTVTQLRKAAREVEAGAWESAQSSLDEAEGEWPDASAIGRAELAALQDTLRVALTAAAERAVEHAEADTTLDTVQAARERLTALSREPSELAAALFLRMEALEDAWVARLRAQLDGLDGLEELQAHSDRLAAVAAELRTDSARAALGAVAADLQSLEEASADRDPATAAVRAEGDGAVGADEDTRQGDEALWQTGSYWDRFSGAEVPFAFSWQSVGGMFVRCEAGETSVYIDWAATIASPLIGPPTLRLRFDSEEPQSLRIDHVSPDYRATFLTPGWKYAKRLLSAERVLLGVVPIGDSVELIAEFSTTGYPEAVAAVRHACGW